MTDTKQPEALAKQLAQAFDPDPFIESDRDKSKRLAEQLDQQAKEDAFIRNCSLEYEAAKHLRTQETRIAALEAENRTLKEREEAIGAGGVTGLRKLEGRNKEGLYYLQDSRQYVGNCPLWWRTGGGYTTALDEAAVFTLENAAQQMRTRSTDVPWPCFEMDALRRPTVDCQYMPRTLANQIEAISQEGGK